MIGKKFRNLAVPPFYGMLIVLRDRRNKISVSVITIDLPGAENVSVSGTQCKPVSVPNTKSGWCNNYKYYDHRHSFLHFRLFNGYFSRCCH
jgi:hypothetical protein